MSAEYRSLDAAWEADPVGVRREGEEALAYLQAHLPEDDPFRQDFEMGLALGYRMSLAVRSELHEAD